MDSFRQRRVPNIDGLFTYLQSLDWNEPWLFGVGAFYVFLFGGLYLSRRNSAIQSFSFVFMLLTVYMAEDLNEYFAHNHKLFTKHQYFDSSGLFISVIMSGPLLLASAFIVANWFYVSSQLMTQVKILQLQRLHHQQSQCHTEEQQQQPRDQDNIVTKKKKKKKE